MEWTAAVASGDPGAIQAAHAPVLADLQPRLRRLEAALEACVPLEVQRRWLQVRTAAS